ncbi:hypothetical protein BJV77DRAFT_998642, partial [Russula vinacea]
MSVVSLLRAWLPALRVCSATSSTSRFLWPFGAPWGHRLIWKKAYYSGSFYTPLVRITYEKAHYCARAGHPLGLTEAHDLVGLCWSYLFQCSYGRGPDCTDLSVSATLGMPYQE